MNVFETIANEVDKKKLNNETSQEFAIEWVRNSKTATVTFPGNTKYNSKIRKLAESNPDDVKIRHENVDGSIVATLPVSFIRINGPRSISEEQRQAAAERFKKMREERNSLPKNVIN